MVLADIPADATSQCRVVADDGETNDCLTRAADSVRSAASSRVDVDDEVGRSGSRP